jgi:hypothetical protein
LPSYPPAPGLGQPPAYQSPSYGSAPGTAGPPYAATTDSKFAPAYPPAGGPQKPGNPGLVACGVVALFGLLGLVCCGGVGFVFYNAANEFQLANNQPAPDPPPFNAPNFNPPNFNPPIAPQPIQIPPINIPQHEFPPITPPITPPVIPEVPTIDPFEPIVPPPTIPGVSIPGTPAGPRTLDTVLGELKAVDPSNFNARQLLTELSTMQVEDARRGDVVDAVLNLWQRSANQGFVLAGPGQAALEKWATSAESTKLARFAAEDKNQPMRRSLLLVIAKNGGDAETAKAILPMMSEPSMIFPIRDALEKIGPAAEDPLLEYLDANSGQNPNLFLYQTLGKIGGQKTKTRMQALAESRGPASGFGRIALRELEKRERSPRRP